MNPLLDEMADQIAEDVRAMLADAWDEGHRRGLLDAELQDVADNPYRHLAERPAADKATGRMSKFLNRKAT